MSVCTEKEKKEVKERFLLKHIKDCKWEVGRKSNFPFLEKSQAF